MVDMDVLERNRDNAGLLKLFRASSHSSKAVGSHQCSGGLDFFFLSNWLYHRCCLLNFSYGLYLSEVYLYPHSPLGRLIWDSIFSVGRWIRIGIDSENSNRNWSCRNLYAWTQDGFRKIPFPREGEGSRD